MTKNLKKTRFLKSEDGAVSILNLYLCIAIAVLAGIAIDMSSLVQTRTNLQVAADAAAHAALVTREFNDVQTSKDKALEVANANLPSSYGIALEAQDIQFGTYDQATHTFTVDNTLNEAVHVMTERALADSNGVSSFLLDFIGYDAWDVRTSSVYETYIPKCFREGFVADSYIDIQSGSNFTNGFCIHSNSHVELNNNNFFQTGVIVSMPNQTDVVVPVNATNNPGLDKALRSYKYDIKILNRLNDIKNGINDPSSPYYRKWLTSTAIISKTAPKNNTKMTAVDFTAGRLHYVKCTGGNPTLTLDGPFLNVGIITDCPIVFGNGVQLIESTVITEDTSNASWSTPNGLVLGLDDKCASGGSTQLLSYGSVDSASGLKIYGSQVIVAGDINFSSQATGEGAAVVAGGIIDSQSGLNFSYCGANMDENFLAWYFRLVG